MLWYGMVRQFQQSYFGERYQSTYWGYSAPDFAQVARAYGIASYTVEDKSDVQHALEKMWHDPQTPFLLQVMINTFCNVYPKIAFGRPITEMEPFIQPIEWKRHERVFVYISGWCCVAVISCQTRQ